MNKTIKKFLIPALVAAPLLFSCNPEDGNGGPGGGSGTIELLVWEDASNIETLETIAEYFKADYKQTYPHAPDINIRFEARQEAAAVSDLLTIGEGDNSPDIAAITSDTLSTAVQADLIAPAEYNEEVKNCFDDDVVGNVTLNDTIYAYPITSESQTIMYDKSKVSDPSIFDDFDKLLASGEKLAWDVNGEDSAYYMFGFLTDANLFGADGTDASSLDLDTPKAVKNYTDALTKYGSCFEPVSPEVAAALLRAGEVAGIVSSPFMYRTLTDAMGEDNIGLHVLPKINGEDMRPFSGYKEYVVSSYTDQPALAHMFANYLVSADNQIQRMLDLNYLPTRYDGEIESFLAESDILDTYQDSYDLSIPMPTIEQMGYYWSPMINFCQEMWDSRTTLTEATVKAGLQEVEDTIKG